MAQKISQVFVVAALYAAHAQKKSLNTGHILGEIQRTKPLSVVMAEKIALLRRCAEGKTVACDQPWLFRICESYHGH